MKDMRKDKDRDMRYEKEGKEWMRMIRRMMN